jgi:hypothetical protein
MSRLEGAADVPEVDTEGGITGADDVGVVIDVPM